MTGVQTCALPISDAEMIADALTDAAVTKQRADAVVTRAATADATKEKNADATDS